MLEEVRGLEATTLRRVNACATSLNEVARVSNRVRTVLTSGTLPTSVTVDPATRVTVRRHLFTDHEVVTIMDVIVNGLNARDLILRQLRLLLTLTGLLLRFR